LKQLDRLDKKRLKRREKAKCSPYSQESKSEGNGALFDLASYGRQKIQEGGLTPTKEA